MGGVILVAVELVGHHGCRLCMKFRCESVYVCLSLYILIEKSL